MYRIQGSDGREYGPVPAGVVRQWLAEGRANAATRVLPEGETEWRTIQQLPEFAGSSVPPPIAGPPPAADSGLNTLIPYRNGLALAAYYCGIFSLIPCLGLVLGVVALVLGVMGWRRYRAQPACGGSVHAWVGIVLGGLCSAGNIVGIVLMAASARR